MTLHQLNGSAADCGPTFVSSFKFEAKTPKHGHHTYQKYAILSPIAGD